MRLVHMQQLSLKNNYNISLKHIMLTCIFLLLHLDTIMNDNINDKYNCNSQNLTYSQPNGRETLYNTCIILLVGAVVGILAMFVIMYEDTDNGTDKGTDTDTDTDTSTSTDPDTSTQEYDILRPPDLMGEFKALFTYKYSTVTT